MMMEYSKIRKHLVDPDDKARWDKLLQEISSIKEVHGVLNTKLQKRRVDVKSDVTRLKSSELTNCFIKHHNLVKSYKEALDATIGLLKDNCKSERVNLCSSKEKEFEIA